MTRYALFFTIGLLNDERLYAAFMIGLAVGGIIMAGCTWVAG